MTGVIAVYSEQYDELGGGTFSCTLWSAFLVYASSFSLSDVSLLFSDSRFFKSSFNLFTLKWKDVVYVSNILRNRGHRKS